MTPSPQALAANPKKILIMTFFWMFMVVLPVLVPYFQSRGLTLKQVFELQAIFSLLVLILEVPSGYISDLMGRKRTLVLAAFFQGVGFSLLPWVNSFEEFIVFEAILALAVSLFSGTDVAMLYDTYASLPHPAEPPIRTMGKRLYYLQIGETVAAVIGGLVAAISISYPPLVQMFTGWIPFFIALTLVEPPREMPSNQHLGNFKKILVALFRDDSLLRLIVFTNMLSGAATLLAVWGYQAYWKAEGIPLAAFGWLWALYNLAVALTARVAHQAESRIGMPVSVLLIGLLPVIGYFAIGNLGIVAGITLGLCIQMSRGLNQVILRDAINTRIRSDLRATGNSIASLGTRVVFVALGPIIGGIMDADSVQTGFNYLGLIFAVVFVLTNLPLAWMYWKGPLTSPRRH